MLSVECANMATVELSVCKFALDTIENFDFILISLCPDREAVLRNITIRACVDKYTLKLLL